MAEDTAGKPGEVKITVNGKTEEQLRDEELMRLLRDIGGCLEEIRRHLSAIEYNTRHR